MNQTVQPGSRTGTVSIPASKSQAHRLLICAALGQAPVTIRCLGISKDIAATIGCLNALGAEIAVSGDLITAKPIEAVPEGLCHLPCGESGSTLRFLLPVAGALGASVAFHMEGRLPQRPLHPLDAVLTAHGMTIRQENGLLYSSGQLCPGEFSLPGNVSSQYISGLLMALPLLDSGSALTVTGELESAAYVTMTEDALRRGGVSLRKAGSTWHICGRQRCQFPAQLSAEGDWSNAAFFLCMGALSPEGVTVRGLAPASSQGDRAVLNILAAMGAGALSGFITALLQTKMGIDSLLAGIIVNTGLYSVNIAVMGGSSLLNMNKTETVFTKARALLQGTFLAEQYKLLVAAIAVIAVIVFLALFLHTRLGLAIRATGDNPDMVRSSSINPTFTTIVGLCVANAFTGLSGCLLAQSQKSVSIDIGTGMVTIALASLLMGQVLLGKGSILKRAIGMVVGAFAFRLVYTIALRLDMPAFMLKLVSSVIVVLAIAAPYFKKQLPMLRRRMAARKEARLHAED